MGIPAIMPDCAARRTILGFETETTIFPNQIDCYTTLKIWFSYSPWQATGGCRLETACWHTAPRRVGWWPAPLPNPRCFSFALLFAHTKE